MPTRTPRHKRGTLKKQGGSWILKYYDEAGKQRTTTLGRVVGPDKVSKGEAERRRDDFMAPLNARRPGARGEMTFRQFVEGVYLKERRDPDLESVRVGTDKNERQRLSAYILGHLGNIMFKDLQQDHLLDMLRANRQKGLGQEILSKIRGDVIRICRRAKGKGYLGWDVWEGLDRAKSIKQKREKRTLLVDGFLTACEKLETRDQAAFHLMYFGGLRVSEVFALQRGDLTSRGLRVSRSLYKGVIGPCKTDGSRRPGGLNAASMELIEAQLARLVDDQPEAWLFPSAAISTPEWPENAMKNRIKRALKAAGFGWLTWEVLRYSYVTMTHADTSLNPKMTTFQAGHDGITARKFYVQFGEDELADENQKFYDGLMKGTASEEGKG